MSLQYQHRLHDHHSNDSAYAHLLLGPRLGNGCICDVVDQRCYGCSILRRYTLCSYEGRRPWNLFSTARSSSTINRGPHNCSRRRRSLSLRRHLRIPSGSSHHCQLLVRWYRASTSGHHRRCNPGSILRSCLPDEAASISAHDALWSARPRKLCTADSGQLRAARRFCPVQYLIFHQRDRRIDNCDQQSTSWTSHLGLWNLLVGVRVHRDLALHRR